MSDYGSGPLGDGVPCTRCEKLACDGYCESAVAEIEVDMSVMYLRSIPADLKRRFKTWCADNEISMTDKIVELMKETVQ